MRIIFFKLKKRSPLLDTEILVMIQLYTTLKNIYNCGLISGYVIINFLINLLPKGKFFNELNSEAKIVNI